MATAPETTSAADSGGPLFDFGGAAYDDALYNPATLARSVSSLDDVGEGDLRFYDEEGYLAVEKVYNPAEIQAGLQGLVDLTMGRRPDFKSVMFEAKARDILPSLQGEERLNYVRKLFDFAEYDDRLLAMARHPRLMAVLRRMFGEAEDPVLFSSMAMLKPPRVGREKPWHQDHAYYTFVPGARVVGVWIALDEATIENGCMQMLPELRKRGAILHFKRRDWQICDTEVMGRRSVAAPLPPGGILFFDALLPHGTPENRSAHRRRALQFHYVSARTGKISDEERLRRFGAEGKNVTC